ncbi:MAG TPA: biosynthetic-type acetolactate synthase large subunit [Candidatus Ornithomonoglobus merdipullorum]|uniref:Acetolactate synthase n=1 Tax=Candidatus Ornithomonoglobus merdipullorum TaxID=2840895 RepID=A0A9D1MCN1_9FIRM|nr:biosynthetic-type acetolactate synthase large subunit [Candidatus Ornithomonoglobus merdipullorum]
MQLTGAQIVIECMKEQGVDTIFGYPGGAILNIYDELYKHSDEIRHILVSHEQGASHAADGYARAAGKTGVCFATSGPGSTNLVTGIATANIDSIPVVAITCNVGTPLLGKDSFQEVAISEVVKPITKASFIVMDVNELADTIRKAFSIAESGRKGPVLIDIPKDVTAAKAEYEAKAPVKPEPVTDTIDDAAIARVAELIKNSKKPYVFCGGGVVSSGASEELRELVNKIDAPVCDTLMGKGAFPGTDPHYTGMLGMHGTKTSNFGVSSCDLLLAVGVRFSDRVYGNAKNFAKDAKIVHIEIDEKEVNKNIETDEHIIGDAKEILKRLSALIGTYEHTEWRNELKEKSERFPLRYRTDVLSGGGAITEIYRQTKGQALITTEVGQHQMWAAQFYYYSEPRQFITSGGLGTMGYGLGAAIGAKTARPDKTVVNIAGDGGFRMNMNEIITSVRNNIPIIEVIIDNRVLGMVRQWQTLFYGGRYSHTVLEDRTDYVKLAESMGAIGLRAETPEEFRDAFAKALKADRTVVIDCRIDKDENVYPMVAPGDAISQAFDAEDMQNM